MINSIIEFSVKNKAVVILTVLILMAAGYAFYREMPVDVYPNLNAPIVTVITENPGMAPEDIETLITFPLESSFNSLPHIKRVRSLSSLGISLIKIEFEYGTDIYFARQLVTEKLQLISQQMPEGTDSPLIGPISSMFADAIEFTMKGDDLYYLRDFAEWTLKPRLITASGVSNVINFGGYLKQYHVLLDPDQMLNYGITARDVVTALKENNVNSSGGFIVTGPEEKLVRGIGRIKTVADIENIVLKESDGVPVYIRNVADVKIGAYVRRGTAGENGKEVVAVTVQNQYNANVMKTIENVEEQLTDIKKNLKEGTVIETFYTQLDMIVKSIRNVALSIFIGAVLVVFILYFFMGNLKSTIVVSVSIPLSAIITIIFLKMYDLSINIMTLGGLAIGVGIIVDSSIIMVENIYRHIQENDKTFKDAVLLGAKEVGKPIFFAILIVLAVFAPIFTLHGIEGKMFIPLTFAVSSAVFGSLIISLTLTPVLGSMFFSQKDAQKKESRVLRVIKRLYNPLLDFSLKRRKLVVFIVIIIAALAGALSFTVGSEFMPELDESSLIMDILLPAETSLEESSRIASLISQKVTEIPEVVRVIRRTGRAEAAEHAEPVNLTEANIVLIPKEDRNTSINEIKEEIRHAVEGVPGVLVSIVAPLQHRINHTATGTKAAVAVKVFGENTSIAKDLAQDIKGVMSEIDGVTDLQMEQITGVPQLQMKLKRNKIACYGLNADDVSGVIEIALNGKVATELVETQKRYDIFVRYAENYRDTEEKIANLLIETPSGARIPLSEVCEFVEARNQSIIRRENAIRRIMVQCNVSGRDMGSVVEDIKHQIGQIEIPDGYFVTFGGTYENQISAMHQLAAVVVLTIIIVFCLLYISFRSIKSALLIIINVPLALTGGIFILAATGITLSVPSIVGFIGLIGVAVQDGIVLVSHMNNYQKKGISLRDAVVKACNNKIRPVLMTTFTTLFGLMPLALRSATGSEIQKPLAVVLIFGLIFSTIITMIVLPTLYLAVQKK